MREEDMDFNPHYEFAKGGYIAIYENDGETEYSFELADRSFDKTFKSLESARKYAKSKGYKVLDVTEFKSGTAYAKGGKTKKFPVAVKRRIDEINEMLPKVNESGDYASTYAGSTMESYIILDKPIQIKGNYVYISEEDSRWGNYGFEKRYNVNDTRDTYESINGRKALMYDLGIIKRSFTKLLKSEGKMAKGGGVRTMDEAYVRMNKGYVATIRKYEDLVDHPNLNDSPELIEIVNMNEESSDKFKNQVTDFVSDIIVKTPPRYVEMFLNHANRDVYIYCSHPNGVFGTYEMPNGREFDIFIPYISKGSRELNVEKYKAKSAFTKSMKKYIEENCTSMAKGGRLNQEQKIYLKDLFYNVRDKEDNRIKKTFHKLDELGVSFRTQNEVIALAEQSRTKNLNADDVTKLLSKYAKGGWIQKATKEMEKDGTEGSFSAQANRAGMSTTKFAKDVLKNPSKFKEKTRKRAMFMKNTNPNKFNVGGEIVRAYDVNINSGVGTYARGGKAKRRKQGYNAQLDESLGMRKGAKRTKQQSDKDRRDESKAMSKSMGRRAYAGVRGMDKGRRMMAKGSQISWSYKEFKGDDALEKANKFISKNRNKYQTQLIFINDGFGVEYRPLRKMATGGKITMAGDTDFPSELLNYAKGGKTKEMYFIETGMNTKSGEKKYTYEQGIKRIKSLLKQDKELLGRRKLSSISDDDIVEIGFNHYGFDYADNYAKGGEISEMDRFTKNKFKNLSNEQLVDRINKRYKEGKNDDDEVSELRRRRNEQGFKVVAGYDTYSIEYAKGGKFASGGNVSYNGWTNYATWVTNLEILDGMDWKDYNMGEPISAEQVKDYVDEVMEQSPELALSFANRFLNDVNYYEIVEHINDEFDLDDGEKDEYAKGGKTKKSIRKKPFKRYKGRK